MDRIRNVTLSLGLILLGLSSYGLTRYAFRLFNFEIYWLAGIALVVLAIGLIFSIYTLLKYNELNKKINQIILVNLVFSLFSLGLTWYLDKFYPR